MLWNKLMLALVGYVAGNIVANMFNGKKWENVRSEIKKAHKSWKNCKKILLAEFIDTHKNFLKDLKEMLLTDENKEIFNKKMEEVKNIIKDYVIEWEKLIDELKGKWGEYAVEAGQKLEDLYNQKKGELENVASQIPDKIEKLKEKLWEKYDEMKNKI